MEHDKDEAKILLTGATGTVGGAVLHHLLATGKIVRVLVRDPTKMSNLDHVEVAVGDLSKPETLPSAITGIDRIFLVTGTTDQDAAVISTAKSLGVQQIVKLSTQEAGMPGVEGHSHWHRERERLIEASGLGWIFLRPTMFMDTTLQWASSIRSQGVVSFPSGEGRFAPVDPDDVGAVGANALMSDVASNRAYELTGPELMTIGEMVGILSRVIGKPIQYIDIPESVVKEQFLKMNLPEYVANGLVETFRNLRAGKYAYKTDTVELVTGHSPQTFEHWCREHAAAFK